MTREDHESGDLAGAAHLARDHMAPPRTARPPYVRVSSCCGAGIWSDAGQGPRWALCGECGKSCEARMP